MIVLNVTYKCKPGMREAFLDAIKAEGLDAASRAEEGNSRYDFYFSVDSEDGVALIEYWRDEECLALHNTQPHFKRMGELKKEFVEEVDLKKYTV